MIGIFRFYQDGRLIAEVPNLITTEGAKLITRYLAGQVRSIGEAIALGVYDAAATAGDTRLGFEIDRVQIDVKAADYTNNAVVFKGTLPQSAQYNIYEMGLWSQYSNVLSREFSSRTLTTFDLVVEPWTNVVADTTGTRTSADSAKCTVGPSATVQVRNATVNMDLSGYSGNDLVTLAFYKPDNNINTIKFVFETTTTGGNYSSGAITVSSLPIGYNVISVSKSALTLTGSANWASIDRYGVDVTAGATGSYVNLDAIRIEDTDTVNRDYVLVSHAILGAALTKTSTAPMDVEYALHFTVT